MKHPEYPTPHWGFGMSRPLGLVWSAQARKRHSTGLYSPDAHQFALPVLLLKFPASYLHSSRETRLMKHATCCPPPVRFRYESAPAGNLSPHTPPYGHRVGFVCMGVPPSLGVWANRAALGVPPIHTKPTLWPKGGTCWLILPPGVD